MCRVACVVRRAVQAHAIGRVERVAMEVRLAATTADVLIARINLAVLHQHTTEYWGICGGGRKTGGRCAVRIRAGPVEAFTSECITPPAACE